MSAPARAYLDWNASAPLRPEAREALLRALDRFGNPSSPHREGREARNLVEASREGVADFLGCGPGEVVFTSGGTEANNLALAALAAASPRQIFAAPRIEHPSVLRPLEALARQGWTARWLPVGEDGRAELAGVAPDLGFGALQAANGETGALQPLGLAAETFGALSIPWHCDGVQAWGRVPLCPRALGCATAALSGHKLGAPKGIGALFVRSGTPVEPLLRGGPQERGRRAGTENVAGIAALAAACRAAAADRDADARWTSELRERLVAGAREVFSGLWVNGPEDRDQRLPNTASLSFPGLEGEVLVQALDLAGVAVSAGSACASGAGGPSEVLAAMGLPPWRARGALRVSLGPTTWPEEVERFLAELGRVVSTLGGGR